jgi:thiol-disulfide isomerase/thioredoxin
MVPFVDKAVRLVLRSVARWGELLLAVFLLPASAIPAAAYIVRFIQGTDTFDWFCSFLRSFSLRPIHLIFCCVTQMSTSFLHVQLALFVLLIVSVSSSNGLVRPPSTHAFVTHRWDGTRTAASKAAIKRATSTTRRYMEKVCGDDSGSGAAAADEVEATASWMPTKNGGFLPNLSERLLRRSSTVRQILTVQEYKQVVVDCPHNVMTVVRFYAPWCKACRAIQPLFQRLSQRYSSKHRAMPTTTAKARMTMGVQFVEVPLTKDNVHLHEGLGVSSLPFGHIYHPDVGLTEERSLNRQHFATFEQVLDTYVQGYCDVSYEDDVQ